MKKNILIFGGSGFIGKNLLLSLIKEDFYNITSVARNFNLPKQLKQKINFIKCDLTKIKNFKNVLKGDYDYIINLSGNINHNNRLETSKIHNKVSQRIFSYFSNKKIRLYVQIGSSLEYGVSNSPQKENFNCKPKSFYGKSKFAASKHIIKIAKKKKINYLILRLYQVYGPYQKFDRLIPYIIKNSLLDKKFNCSSGEQLRDFLYIDDLINLFIKIINKKKIKSGIYNVGFGKGIKVKSIINWVVKIIKKGKPLFGRKKMRSDEVKILYPNILKIKKNFNWQPKINIINGLKKTIEHYEKI